MFSSAHVTIYYDDVVKWRPDARVWTTKGEVPFLSIGCPGASVHAYAGFNSLLFPVQRGPRASDPANTSFGVYQSR